MARIANTIAASGRCARIISSIRSPARRSQACADCVNLSASGWEKGQVENQVGNLRDQMFRPKPRVKSLTELNAWLEDQCIAYAKRTRHPEFKDRTIWDVFEEERASLMQLRGPFDGFVEKAVRASTTCLIMADHNRYSVDARAAGRMVLVRSHAERVVVLPGDEVVADHPRHFQRDKIIYDP